MHITVHTSLVTSILSSCHNRIPQLHKFPDISRITKIPEKVANPAHTSDPDNTNPRTLPTSPSVNPPPSRTIFGHPNYPKWPLLHPRQQKIQELFPTFPLIPPLHRPTFGLSGNLGNAASTQERCCQLGRGEGPVSLSQIPGYVPAPLRPILGHPGLSGNLGSAASTREQYCRTRVRASPRSSRSQTPARRPLRAVSSAPATCGTLPRPASGGCERPARQRRRISAAYRATSGSPGAAGPSAGLECVRHPHFRRPTSTIN